MFPTIKGGDVEHTVPTAGFRRATVLAGCWPRLIRLHLRTEIRLLVKNNTHSNGMVDPSQLLLVSPFNKRRRNLQTAFGSPLVSQPKRRTLAKGTATGFGVPPEDLRDETA